MYSFLVSKIATLKLTFFKIVEKNLCLKKILGKKNQYLSCLFSEKILRTYFDKKRQNSEKRAVFLQNKKQNSDFKLGIKRANSSKNKTQIIFFMWP